VRSWLNLERSGQIHDRSEQVFAWSEQVHGQSSQDLGKIRQDHVAGSYFDYVRILLDLVRILLRSWEVLAWILPRNSTWVHTQLYGSHRTPLDHPMQHSQQTVFNETSFIWLDCYWEHHIYIGVANGPSKNLGLARF